MFTDQNDVSQALKDDYQPNVSSIQTSKCFRLQYSNDVYQSKISNVTYWPKISNIQTDVYLLKNAKYSNRPNVFHLHWLNVTTTTIKPSLECH